mgnify:CR=1 FL=1
MILTCPACTTRYLVDPGALGSDGRRVRCARCQHTWHAEPVEDDDVDSPDSEADDAAAQTESEAEEQADDDEDLVATRRRSVRARAQLPAVRESGGGGKLWVAWLILALVVAGLVAGSIVYRTEIVTIWPPAGKLYRSVGLSLEPPFTLATDEVKFENVIRDGGTVLLVTGVIRNNGSIKQAIPLLQVTLLDGQQKAIHHWTAQVEQTILGPDESVAFQTQLRNPPDSARFLKVDFLLKD